jgi:hypothetical protein
LETLSSYLSPNFSNSLTIQIQNGKINSNNLMISNSLNQNSTHQRSSKPHHKPSNLKKPLNMIATGFWAFHY